MARVLKSWDEAKPGAIANMNAVRKAASGERTSNVENDNQVEEATEVVEEEVVEEATSDDAEETTEGEASEGESE